jgi:hypothetical protein
MKSLDKVTLAILAWFQSPYILAQFDSTFALAKLLTDNRRLTF